MSNQARTFEFKPAVRSHVPLIIGIISGTGGGKTMSAMRLAKGICGENSFAVCDTENGRAKHYADMFRFDHGDIRAPFRPDAYWDAIKSADDAGYPVIIVDSTSHVWAGDGGVLDWQEEELYRMAGNDWQKREKVKMAAWIKPKIAHKQMVQKMLQVRAHLILCFRAEQKIEMIREDGKTKIVAKQSLTGLDGWIPVCEKNLPFELTASFLLTADAPGMPKPIKLQQQHRALFPLDQPINEESGRLVADWAKGGDAPKPTQQTKKTDALPDDDHPASDHLLEELGGAFMDKNWNDAKQEDQLITVSGFRERAGQSAVTKWSQCTCKQIRWAISQVK